MNTELLKGPSGQHELNGKGNRFDSWKEIATYLRRGVRTVQLWEHNEELPVRRHLHNKTSTIYAYQSEIDAWSERRSCRRDESRSTDREFQWRSRPVKINSSRKIMLAVLPFSNLSGDPQQESFSDGLTDEIITDLGRINARQLGVIGRTSAMHYKNTPQRIDQVGRELGVDYVLEGSVRRLADRFRINVQLSQVADQSTLWSESYDRDVADIFAVQIDIAKRISRSLSMELLHGVDLVPARIASKSGPATEAYLKGRYFFNQRTEQSVRKAIQFFDRAVQEDSAFASAYSGLADCYTVSSFYEVLPPMEAMPKARLAALKALELNNTLGEAHASLADVHMHFEWDWPNAETEYKLAIEFNPGYVTAYQWYANFLGLKGLPVQARQLIGLAETLDPLSVVVKVWSGVIFHYSRQYQKAIEEYMLALELDPNFVWAHVYLGLAYEQQSLTEEAIDEFRRAITLSGGNPCISAMLAHVYAAGGKRSAALRLLETLKRGAKKANLPCYDIAAVYAALNDKREALDWLFRALDQRNARIVGLGREPRFDCLRSESRFQQLMVRLSLV